MSNALSQTMLDIIPVSKWNEHFAYPTVGAIRQWMLRNTKDFNNIVLRKIGKRNYIRVSAFDQWVEDTNR